MSFGSATGRTRLGSKGSSSKAKKLKRKKDEFHSHKKLHVLETGPVDLEQVKARTVLALDRLGHQMLSAEPGGYALQSWMKNFNSLLDDFQEKIGPGRLPTEFDGRRREVDALLLAPPDSSDIDSEIEKLLQEQDGAMKVVEEEAAKTTARLRSLRGERDGCEKDIKEEKKKLSEMNQAKQSRRFFSRLIRAGPSTELSEERIKELESKLNKVTSEIDEMQRARATDSPVVVARQKAESIQKKLDDLRLSKQAKSQFILEREVAAKTMSEVVSQVQVVQSGTEP